MKKAANPTVAKRTGEELTASKLPNLAAKAEFGDDGAVAGDVAILQIAQQTAALTDQTQQTQTRSVVLFVRLEVTGEVVHAGRNKRDLHFGGAGIRLMFLMFTNGRDFFTFCDRHYILPIFMLLADLPVKFYCKGQFDAKTRGEASLTQQEAQKLNGPGAHIELITPPASGPTDDKAPLL